VIPLLLDIIMTTRKRKFGIAFSRFSDYAKQLKMPVKDYIDGVVKNVFRDRIITMHLNYGAVPLLIFKNGCDDPNSMNYSVLMDYTPLAVFMAARLKGREDGIYSAIKALFGRKYRDIFRLADRLAGSPVTAEKDESGITYTINYQAFLDMMKTPTQARNAQTTAVPQDSMSQFQ